MRSLPVCSIFLTEVFGEFSCNKFNGLVVSTSKLSLYDLKENCRLVIIINFFFEYQRKLSANYRNFIGEVFATSLTFIVVCFLFNLYPYLYHKNLKF